MTGAITTEEVVVSEVGGIALIRIILPSILIILGVYCKMGRKKNQSHYPPNLSK